MSPQARTGLIAVGIVGGLALVAGVLVVMAARQESPRSSGSLSAPPTDSPSPKEDPEGYVRNHRWWAKPITQKQLDDFLEQVTSASVGTTVWFDNRLKVVVAKKGEDARPLDRLGTDHPTSIHIDYGPGVRRWTRPIALSHMIDALDAAEFRDGPGRK